MDVGTAIRNARKDRGLTQEQLAAKVFVTRQAVSRWENGESEPDIDMRRLLANALDVHVSNLLDLPEGSACQRSENRNVAANLKRSAFYVCPDCSNVIWASGEAAVSCCEKAVDPLSAKRNDGALDALIEVSDGCQRVYIAHPMAKQDHLLFIAAVGDDLVRIKRLYPEQEARAEFPLQGRCDVFAYGKGCGLVKL